MQINTSNVEFGDKVKDEVTGLVGHVTGVSAFITGCAQMLVQPQVDKDKKYVAPHWIDAPRLTVMKGAKLTMPADVQVKDKPPGGPGDPAEYPPTK